MICIKEITTSADIIKALELIGVNKMTLTLKVKRLTETAKLPTYAHDGDACFDLYADSVTSSNGGTVFTCGTGLAVDIPQGYALMVYSRSGHGFNHNTRLSNAVGVGD